MNQVCAPRLSTIATVGKHTPGMASWRRTGGDGRCGRCPAHQTIGDALGRDGARDHLTMACDLDLARLDDGRIARGPHAVCECRVDLPDPSSHTNSVTGASTGTVVVCWNSGK